MSALGQKIAALESQAEALRTYPSRKPAKRAEAIRKIEKTLAALRQVKAAA